MTFLFSQGGGGGRHFGNFHAEISPFLALRIRDFYLNGGNQFIFIKPNFRTVKSFPAIQKRVSGEKVTFSLSQGVILVIFMLKFRHFPPLEFGIST